MPTSRGFLADDPLRALPRGELEDLLDDLVKSWPRVRSSEHLRLEIATASRRGHEPRSFPPSEDLRFIMEGRDRKARQNMLAVYTSDPAMAPGVPVPGCDCEACTGMEENHPARLRPRPRGRSESWERQVEEARARPLLEVAQVLGLEPRKAGRDSLARCPFHEDRTPSLSLTPDKGLWHCFSCGRGGDGIGLYMEVRRVEFGEAVRELAS